MLHFYYSGRSRRVEVSALFLSFIFIQVALNMQESLSSSAHTFCKILYCETNQDGGNVNNAIHVVFALNG